MPRKRRSKGKPTKLPRKPQPPQTKAQGEPILFYKQKGFGLVRRLASRLWKIVVLAGVLIGLFGGVVQLYTRISISPQAPLSPSNIFTTPFIISNDGLLPIYDVGITCNFSGVIDIYGNVWVDNNYTPGYTVIKMEAGEQVVMGCPSRRTKTSSVKLTF